MSRERRAGMRSAGRRARGGLFGQCEVEGRALVGLGLRPGPPAVARDDAADVGQANPGAFKFVLAMQPLENAEQFVGVFHVKPGAVVADKDDRFQRGFILTADGDDGGVTAPAVL